MIASPLFLGKMTKLCGFGVCPEEEGQTSRRKPVAFNMVPWHDRRVAVIRETEYRALLEHVRENTRKLDMIDKLVKNLRAKVYGGRREGDQ